ncbi:unnamed protein product [Paramecium octaurelia]|uniref:Uncharacterized protein n=1 Tax=Paramecium octaurelia TaxID=43137 RepID=A0A8S1YLK7_PAROT|nr:unnamed protein product [Paramecium octaurelia]
MTKALFLTLYLKTVFTDYVFILDPEQPFIVTEFEVSEIKYEAKAVFWQGAWFQFLLLTSIIQAYSIGILDSYCYHLYSVNFKNVIL